MLRGAGVRIDLLAPPPHTTVELAAALSAWELAGRRVAVQLHGGSSDDLLATLAARGAEVLTLSPYAWDRPADPGPVARLIEALRAGTVDALLGTSAVQVETLFGIAREQGQEAAVRQALASVPVAAQGPVCAAAFARHGVTVTISPPTGHMGALVLAVARYFDEQATPAPTAALAVPGGR
jgi:uroporphyrinogen-III synthase